MNRLVLFCFWGCFLAGCATLAPERNPVPRGGEVFVQGGAQVDECAVFFVECAEFGLKGREEPSLKRLPEDVYGLKGFVGNFLPYAGKTRIINSVTLGSARGACSWPQKNLTPSANADRGFARTSFYKTGQ